MGNIWLFPGSLGEEYSVEGDMLLCSRAQQVLRPLVAWNFVVLDRKWGEHSWESFCFALLPSSSPFLLFPRHAKLSTLGLCTRPVYLSGIIFQIVPWLASLAISSFCSDIASLKWIPLTILCEASSSLKLFNLLPCFLFCCSIDPCLTLLKLFVDWLILCLLHLECKLQEGRAPAVSLEQYLFSVLGMHRQGHLVNEAGYSSIKYRHIL